MPFWPDSSAPDELKETPRFFKLNVLAAGLIPRRIRKAASLDEGGQEVVHHDTAPFQLKHGQQQPRAHRQHIRMGGVRERRGEKAVEVIELHRYGRLGKEIAYRFCRVVPAGIFEIDEDELAARRDNRVVKAEVRRGDATVLGAEHRALLKTFPFHFGGYTRAKAYPPRPQLGRKSSGFFIELRCRRNRGKPVDTSLHQRQMI